MADYPEQCMLTGVKYGRQCPICKVPEDERGDLRGTWAPRTHEDTRAQIDRQRRNKKIKSTDEDWAHPVENFAWRHHFVNIHAGMMLDPLHQLLKGIVQRLIEWLKKLINETVHTSESSNQPRKKRAKRSGKRLVDQSTADYQIDHRFKQSLPYVGLKHFGQFSSVSQWTGNERKQVVRQLLPVITPLLKKQQAALACSRAILDFVTIAQYTTHDESTLMYMDHALERIDKLIGVFNQFRPVDKDGEPTFNIPKLHAMTHYREFIQRYGSLMGTDSGVGEVGHKTMLKEFFSRTNKGRKYEQQILWHNIRKVNSLAMKDVIFYHHTRAGTSTDTRDEVQVNKPTRDRLDLRLLRIRNREENIDLLNQMKIPLGTLWQWRQARDVGQHFGIKDFVPILAVFVRESRKKLDGIVTKEHEMDDRERDPGWAENWLVGLHPSMTCWPLTGKNSANPDERSCSHARCSQSWRSREDEPRKDFVWVQEYAVNSAQTPGYPNGNVGRLIGQLKLILTVIDPERLGEPSKSKEKRHIKYSGALIQTYSWCRNGLCDPIHGMFEVEPIPPSQATRPRKLGATKIYPLSTILKCAHLIPVDLNISADTVNTRMFVNNYIDWEAYNTLYDSNWQEHLSRQADKLAEDL